MLYPVVLSLVAVLNIFLALFIISKNHKNHINLSFGLFILSVVAWIVVNYLSNHFTEYSFLLFFNKLIFFIGPYIVYFLLYFALVFPRYLLKFNIRSLLIILFIPVVISNLLTIYDYVISDITFLETGGTGVVFGDGILLFVAQFLLYFLLAIGLLIHKFIKSKGYDRLQLQYLLLGISILMVIGTIMNLIIPLVFNNYTSTHYGPFSSIAVVGFTSYAILRHRLLDIRLVVARTVAYSILIITIAVFYTGAVFLLSRSLFVGEISGDQIAVYSVVALFVAFTFQPLKSLLENITDRLFFRSKYNTAEVLSELSHILATTIQLDRVTKETLQVLLDTMHISKGAFVIYDKDEIYYSFNKGFNETLKLDGEPVKVLSNLKKITIVDEVKNEKVQMAMRELNVDIVVPLSARDNSHGMVLLGEKKSGGIFSDQDIKILEIFAPEVSVALENAKSYAEIKRFNETLELKIVQATKNLRNANERLKQLDKLKDEFVSIASHELRTPMSVIRSYLWMILQGKSGKINNKQKDYLEKAYSTSDRLISLVNDMLNTSRIESGRMKITKQKTDLVNIVEKVTAGMSLRAKEDQLELIFEKPNKPIPQFEVDTEKIEQVLINLIGNSLKFTPQGGSILVTLDCNSKKATISVKDTGIGIRKNDMSKLFQKFASLSADYKVRTNAQSTGLGLYLSKSIIKMHGGDMWAESEGEGKGSKFTFTLPLV